MRLERRSAIVPSPQPIIGPASGWLIAAIVAGIVEVLSPTFGFLFVSGAALVAAGLAALGASFLAQLGCFAALLLVCLVFLRPRFVRRLGALGVPTRTEALIGKFGCVTVAVGPATGSGRVEVAGQDWAAHSTQALAPGTQVVVEGADGIVLHVRAAETPRPPD